MAKKEPQFIIMLTNERGQVKLTVKAKRVGPLARAIHSRMHELLAEFIAVRHEEAVALGLEPAAGAPKGENDG